MSPSLDAQLLTFTTSAGEDLPYIYLVVESVPERATYLEFAPRFLPEPQE